MAAGQHNKKNLKMKTKKPEITLALQGGGSHGAFTWGVLEKLLEEDLFNKYVQGKKNIP